MFTLGCPSRSRNTSTNSAGNGVRGTNFAAEPCPDNQLSEEELAKVLERLAAQAKEDKEKEAQEAEEAAQKAQEAAQEAAQKAAQEAAQAAAAQEAAKKAQEEAAHPANNPGGTPTTIGVPPAEMMPFSACWDPAFMIKSKETCKAMAKSLGLPEMEPGDMINPDRPKGCYWNQQTKLLIFNTDGYIEKRPDDTFRRSICNRAPTHVKMEKSSCDPPLLIHTIHMKARCERAANELGLPITTPEAIDDPQKPHGCWVDANQGGKLVFNKGGVADGSIEDPSIKAVCKRAPTHEVMPYRSCWDQNHAQIHNKDRCERAAKEIGLPSTEAVVMNDPKLPYGCYWNREVQKLRFNPVGTQERNTEDLSRRAICKRV